MNPPPRMGEVGLWLTGRTLGPAEWVRSIHIESRKRIVMDPVAARAAYEAYLKVQSAFRAMVATT